MLLFFWVRQSGVELWKIAEIKNLASFSIPVLLSKSNQIYGKGLLVRRYHGILHNPTKLWSVVTQNQNPFFLDSSSNRKATMLSLYLLVGNSSPSWFLSKDIYYCVWRHQRSCNKLYSLEQLSSSHLTVFYTWCEPLARFWGNECYMRQVMSVLTTEIFSLFLFLNHRKIAYNLVYNVSKHSERNYFRNLQNYYRNFKNTEEASWIVLPCMHFLWLSLKKDI